MKFQVQLKCGKSYINVSSPFSYDLAAFRYVDMLKEQPGNGTAVYRVKEIKDTQK